ncbi:oligopeptide transporter 5-like isoform X2 [Papaver somniferum]|uniref:oligopeptide transporter 5-like isoform X2 n=1 Tax=Papaver somniferum TaxID=3469 RepID=UPI000E6FD517|nr:oligopeptide transporter 5-like isoform X2 [Papaver somniferum]
MTGSITIGVAPHTKSNEKESISLGDEINDSPIEEVRLTVPITDDATLPVLTFRTWVLGPTTCILLAVLTARFECRQITIIPSASCFTMLFLPIGKLMAATLPTKPIRTLWTRWSVSMNPGSFNLKEHVLISILATAGLDNPFSLPIVVIAKAFYHKNISFWVCFLLVQSTNESDDWLWICWIVYQRLLQDVA